MPGRRTAEAHWPLRRRIEDGDPSANGTSRTGESHGVIDLVHLPTSRQPGQIGVTKASTERRIWVAVRGADGTILPVP
ncbi:MAG: hypothetical protein QOJ23_4176, partial [Actinomycetota bacterium]|nr:hypothetical protein [Actinomycetota bacterium]